EEALKKLVPELRKEADLVVLLAHTSIPDALKLAEEVPGIDVVVIGHNPGYMNSPDRIGDVLMVRGGARGQYAAQLKVTVDGKDGVTDYKGQVDALSQGVVPDPSIGALVTAFQDSLTQWQAR